MKESDFYTLCIGQEIYWKSVLVFIRGIWMSGDDSPMIQFDSIGLMSHHWNEICADCSLEAPRPKRKLYRHVVELENGGLAASFVDTSHMHCLGVPGTILETEVIWEEP